MATSRPLTHTQASLASQQAYDDVLLNRYRIINSRGTGGFGTVLTCWDTRLQRRVAIKRMPLAGTDAASTLREALAEARTSSLLGHPNIVTVFDFEVEGSYAYLVMEYVDGLTLAELLARVEGGTLTYDETACLVQSVASALGYAHENGVLHLDIKPTNIIIDRKGAVKLCDFGMATLASAAGYGDARGGTVGYMPPEQIEGGIVDERTDVFSLAVVVWQALLGSSPFAASSAERSLALIRKGPIKPSRLDQDLSGMAEEALLGALAPNPSARIPSVETLAKELVFALGDPSAGAESLRDLLSQAQDGTENDVDDWEGERLPLGISHPWVPKAFTRVLAAALTGLAIWPLAPVVLTDNPALSLAAPAACAAMAAIWPPLGSALVATAFCVSVALHASSAAPLLLAIVMAAVFVLWWVACGTSCDLSTPAVLLPACLSSPIAGVAVAGTAMPPLAAGATTVISWFIGHIWPVAVNSSFVLEGLAEGLVLPPDLPVKLVSLAGCVIAAVATSAITWWQTSPGYAIAGQIVGCALLVGSQLVSVRMENGGIWADPSWANAGVGVLLGVLVCAACVLRGPRIEDQESED